MEPVTLALGLAKLTGLDDWLGEMIGGSKAGKTAAKVLDFASQVTGIKDPEKAAAKIREDEALKQAFKQKMLDNKQELEMAAYKDRTDARAMYRHHPAQADKIADRIMKWNLPFILALVLINALVVFFFETQAAIIATISNIIGIAIKSLFDERKEVTGFFFGGSMHNSPESKE